jgi:hypothetical protein
VYESFINWLCVRKTARAIIRTFLSIVTCSIKCYEHLRRQHVQQARHIRRSIEITFVNISNVICFSYLTSRTFVECVHVDFSVRSVDDLCSLHQLFDCRCSSMLHDSHMWDCWCWQLTLACVCVCVSTRFDVISLDDLFLFGEFNRRDMTKHISNTNEINLGMDRARSSTANRFGHLSKNMFFTRHMPQPKYLHFIAGIQTNVCSWSCDKHMWMTIFEYTHTHTHTPI